MSSHKNNLTKLTLLATVLVFSGCDSIEDSKMDEFNDSFMNNCQASAPGNSELTALCECSLEELAAHFSQNELLGDSKAQDIATYAESVTVPKCLESAR